MQEECEPDLGAVPEVVPDHLDRRLGVSGQGGLAQGGGHVGVAPAPATQDIKLEIRFYQIKTLNPILN